MKKFRFDKIKFLFLGSFFLLFLIPIYSDKIILKDGEILGGKILEVTNEKISILTNEITVEVEKNNIKYIRIGYAGGAPACIKLFKKEKDCSMNLFNIKNNNLIFIVPNSDEKPKIFKLKKIEFLEIENIGETSLASILEKNIKFNFLLKSGYKVKGKIKNFEDNQLKVNLGNRKTAVLKEKEIRSLTYEHHKVPWDYLKIAGLFVPGIYQQGIERYIVLSIFTGLAVGMIYENYMGIKAIQDANKKKTYIPVGNTYVEVSNPDYSAYERHKKNFIILGIGMGALYTYNTIRVLTYKKKEVKKLTMYFDYSSRNIKTFQTKKSEIFENYFEFKIVYNF